MLMIKKVKIIWYSESLLFWKGLEEDIKKIFACLDSTVSNVLNLVLFLTSSQKMLPLS